MHFARPRELSRFQPCGSVNRGTRDVDIHTPSS